MKLKTLIIFLMLFLVVPIVNALPREPLLAETFFFDESMTTSTTYVNVDSDVFNITRETEAFIRISFQATKTTGSAAATDFFWRVLFDGEEITNLTQALEVDETAPLELQMNLATLNFSEHNITLQHRVASDTLTTNDMSAAIITTQFLNGTSITGQNNTFDFTVDDIVFFTLLYEFIFTKSIDDSSIFVSISGQMTTSSTNVDMEVFAQVGTEQSGVFSSGLESPTDNKVIAYSWFFKDVPTGINQTIQIFARNVQNTKTTFFDGNIGIFETVKDDIEINFVDRRIGTFSTSSLTPVIIDSLLINVSDKATLVIAVESTATKSTAGKDNITMFINIEGFGGSFNHTIQLEGAADVGNFPFIAVPPALPSLVGEKNITLQAFVQDSTTVTFTNICKECSKHKDNFL